MVWALGYLSKISSHVGMLGDDLIFLLLLEVDPIDGLVTLTVVEPSAFLWFLEAVLIAGHHRNHTGAGRCLSRLRNHNSDKRQNTLRASDGKASRASEQVACLPYSQGVDWSEPQASTSGFQI